MHEAMTTPQTEKPPARASARSAVALAVALASLLGLACGTGRIHHDHSKEPDPRGSGYKLGPSDEVRIDVWRNPTLSTATVVRPDGVITMPLVGDLQAVGRTTRELKEEIVKKLGDYIKDESIVVTVAVTKVNSYHFTVTGEVTHPGLFSASRYVTVSEAVAMAGGPTRFAELERVVVIRRRSTKKRGPPVRRIPINYEAIAKGLHPEENIVLLPGDVVHVP